MSPKDRVILRNFYRIVIDETVMTMSLVGLKEPSRTRFIFLCV